MKRYFIFTALLAFSLLSCRKEPGEGGKASINGLLWQKDYNANFSTLLMEREAFDVYVYIRYGDDINYSDRIKTNPEGRFEFKYLRPGKYTIYFVSKDPSDKDNIKPDEDMVVEQEVEITEKKQVISLDTLVIYN